MDDRPPEVGSNTHFNGLLFPELAVFMSSLRTEALQSPQCDDLESKLALLRGSSETLITLYVPGKGRRDHTLCTGSELIR